MLDAVLSGIKAVVWTDTIQIFLMYGSIITVMVRGVMEVIETARELTSMGHALNSSSRPRHKYFVRHYLIRLILKVQFRL